MTIAGARTIQELRQAGLRVTAHRFAVLEWLDAHPHATADEIGAGVQERMGSISTQTVYSPPCLTPDEEHGFDIDEAEVVFWGRCRACRASNRRRAPAATRASNDARADRRPAPLTAEV